MKKPINSKWTDEQWAAITERGRNLLVAAAAGSGKTAVLVERIIRKILDEKQPCDVDRLLVVTFTKAAAAEMKDRIRRELEAKAAEPGRNSNHLRRQLALIHRASITTLHSFCLDVVRQHVQELDIDPSFRIANETEIEMIRQDIVEEMLEDYYASSEEGSAFWQLVDSYSGQRSDAEISRFILRLYDFSRSQPFPDLWLRQAADAFHAAEEHQHVQVWLDSLMQEAALELEQAMQLLQQAAYAAKLPNGPLPYLTNIQEETEALKEMLSAARRNDWQELHELMQSFQFGRLKPCKKDETDPDLQESVKQIREEAKKNVTALKQELFVRSLDEYREELQQLAPLMEICVGMVQDFGERLKEEKRRRAMLDFTDLEHECLRILMHPDSSPDKLVPSEAALSYRQQFEEVLVDEYQDTNRVQEAILTLVSQSEPGNRFMVGDVKQSIYRFRLAEPKLFLEKYRHYRDEPSVSDDEKAVGANRLDDKQKSIAPTQDGESAPAETGRKIDLARNFRSRKTIVNGINYIFQKIMNETAFEIEYDDAAALVHGAEYFPEPEKEAPIEVLLIDKAAQADNEGIRDGNEEQGADDADQAWSDAEELETVQMEIRAVIAQIRALLGLDGGEPAQIYDKDAGGLRPITYRDIVILLRATKQWAPVMMEELKEAGIPSYAELNTGYFEAGEVELMVSLLQVIDNPDQDIPLAAVLRSPIVGLNADEMARVRLLDKQSYFQAVRKAVTAEEELEAEVRHKLSVFISQLEAWRTAARRQSLSELIALIYQETGFLELAGAMPGGMQRKANLRALYDRAKQYESTSYRGLFRFLRFIERLKDNKEDLGAARALGEQEDVVRIVSIHKSKGLEYPVVFVCGLGKKFNRQDLTESMLMHAELGLGPKIVDMHHRVIYPSLPFQAIQRKIKREMLAEEMRVLYVALTRAKERLYLVGSASDLQSAVQRWSSLLPSQSVQPLPNVLLTKAQSMLDWIVPALLMHPAGAELRQHDSHQTSVKIVPLQNGTARFAIRLLPADWDGFAMTAAARQPADPHIVERLKQLQPIPASQPAVDVSSRLSWKYPMKAAERYLSKISVSEMKRLHSLEEEEAFADTSGLELVKEAAVKKSAQSFRWSKDLLERPRFLTEQRLTPVERGTAYHTVMQLIPLHRKLDAAEIETFKDELVRQFHLSPQQKDAVDAEQIAQFFETEVGRSLLSARWVRRELPFSFGLPASEVYSDAEGTPAADETMIIQGVIDCIFETDEGELILLDYKSDAAYGQVEKIMKERYQVQISLYKRAIEHIWERPVDRCYLYMFDGAHWIDMS